MTDIKRAMVFGVFDGLHEGHKHFLVDAKGRCEKLIVVVTRDSVSKTRKGFAPKRNEAERVLALKDYDGELSVVLGDDEDGSWHVLDAYDPERVFLGYDQAEMSIELKKMGIPFTFLDAYKPGEYRSSLFR